MSGRLRAAGFGRVLAALLALTLAAACAPTLNLPGPPINAPLLTDTGFHAADGAILPVRRWWPEKGDARAVVVALHGFNDYSNFFDAPGAMLAKLGIGSYAYDQRGFGAAPGRGLWPGTDAFTADLKAFTRLVGARHPGTPLYLLGASMGGAVIIVALADPDAPPADGVILSAPAVWGRTTMPWYQRLALWLGVHVMPGAELTARGLKITPSDNIEMLRALGRDPKIIKATRVDAIYGLTNLMDQALAKSAELRTPALVLYGAKDEIIPRRPTRIMLDRLAGAGVRTGARHRVALYDDGYHMLLRDLKAATPLADIVHWMAAPQAPLPSKADAKARAWLGEMAARP